MAHIDLDQYYEDYEDYRPQDKHSSKQKSKKTKDKEERSRKKDKRSRHIDSLDGEFDDSFGFEWPDLNLTDEKEQEEEREELPREEEAATAAVVEETVPPVPTLKVLNLVAQSQIHTIKGNSIDFSKVVAMEPTERMWHNNMAYGIRFFFRGSDPAKDYSKIAWFNTNVAERDRVFDLEQSFWKSLQKNLSGKM